jgi:alkylation response protein AidB-like acyl-CoA dehydrogenase
MDFNLTEDQNAIKDVVDRIFADLCTDDRIRKEYDAARPLHRELWQQLAEAGVLGASLPEAVGGAGLSFAETCLLLEAQGRSVAPVPLLETVVENALPLARHARSDAVDTLLGAVCRGEAIIAPVRPYRGLQEKTPLSVKSSGDQWLLNGSSASTPWAPLATHYLVSARDTGGRDLLLLAPADMANMRRVDQTLIGGGCAAILHFDNATLPVAALLASGDTATAFLATREQLTMTGLAAQQVGVLEEGLKRTAAYDNERKQFGRPLSSFQAVAHQAADAYMEIEALRGVYWRALDDIDAGRDAGLSAHAAKYWLCRAGHRVAHTVMHLHGGMGQDLEYPIHRFFTWAKKNERYLGSATDHSRSIGELIASEGIRSLSLVA